MSCLIYAQAIAKVAIIGEDNENKKKYKITCKGSAYDVSDLESKLKPQLKAIEGHYQLTYIEDTMKPKDPEKKPHDWENFQTFELEINYGTVLEQ